jgi:type VI secretion system protein ImpF
MARIHQRQPLVPSILDRLLDDEPENRQEALPSRGQLLREMTDSVRRDLEELLNTRWRCRSWPEEWNELDTSLVSYGIPDFTGAGMSSPEDREKFREDVEKTIRKFEPRFKSVRVSLVPNPDPADRTLRFRFDALLHAHPAPEPVVFESRLEPATKSFEVESQRS